MRDARDGVAELIAQRGLKQCAVAEKAGLTEQQMSDIVKKRRRMDANEMFRICVALDITPNDLFADEPGREAG